MNCDDIETLLHGYMDGELDAVTNQSIEAHLSACTHCSAELASFRELRGGLGQSALYDRAPTALATRVRVEARRLPDLTSRRPAYRWRTLAAAASIAIVCITAWSIVRTRPATVDPTMTAIVDDHVRSLMAEHLVDIRSSDKHTVKPWFDGKLDFAPPVQRLDGTDYPLVGGRLDYIDGHSAAAVVYRHNKHYINLIIWPSPSHDKAPAASSSRGYNVIHWTQAGMTYWAASDISLPDLETFSGLIRQGATMP